MNRILGLIASFAIITLLATGGREQAHTAEKIARPFQETLDQQRTELEVPGISAAVILPDGTTWLGKSGKSSDSEAMNSALIFGLGSVTKTYIVALVLQLAEEDNLSVEDTVGRWITELG